MPFLINYLYFFVYKRGNVKKKKYFCSQDLK